MRLRQIGVLGPKPLEKRNKDNVAVESMAYVVCALLVDGLRKAAIAQDFWKVSIHINDDDKRCAWKVTGGVLMVDRTFPSSDFVTWDLRTRQSYMLNFLGDSMREVFQKRGIDQRPLDVATAYVADCGFRKVIASKRRFVSPNGASKAHIECEQEMNEAIVCAVVRTGKKSERIVVAKTSPNEFIFHSYFGDIRWVDEGQAVLHVLGGEAIAFALSA